ncbi:hypothetical protein [Vibrio phage LP.2]|nr:hypothetical protein [Vibrio phage LP.2]
MVDTTDELKVIIASFVTNQAEVEIVRISHSQITTLYLTSQLEDGATLIDENGQTQTVTYVPMKLTDESSGELLLNERTLTIQGINDLIASEEDKIPEDSDEKVKTDVLSYIADYDGNLSTISQGPYRYFLRRTSYSQKSNNAALSISTTPTNQDTTGDTFDKSNYPTLAGFE